MKPTRKSALVLAILVLTASTLACSMDLGLPTQPPAQVVTVVVPASPVPAQDTQVPPPAPTDTPRPTDTPQPTATPTQGPPMFTAREDTNCRAGPSPVYDVLEAVMTGETVPIIGKIDENWITLWWAVRVDGTNCWVWADLGSTTGDLSQVLPRAAPPTPTPQLVTFFIKNNQPEAICWVFIKPHGAASWGNDRLGNDIIPVGGSYWFTLSVGYYDFRIENCADQVIDGAENVYVGPDTQGFTSP